MGKAIIGVNVNCSAQKREEAGIDSDEEANLVFSFKFPGMTDHYVAKVKATGADLNANGQGDNPKEILEKLKQQIDADVKSGKISKANAARIKMEHKTSQGTRPSEGGDPGRTGGGSPVPGGPVGGGGSGGGIGGKGPGRAAPGSGETEPVTHYYGRIIVDGVDDIDLGSDNAKVDLIPMGIGQKPGITTSAPEGDYKFPTGEGNVDPLPRRGSPYDDPENPAVPLDEEEKKEQEKKRELEAERRRRVLKARAEALKKWWEKYRRVSRKKKEEMKKDPFDPKTEPWEGGSPYTGKEPFPHPDLPKGDSPWDPIGIVVVFLEEDSFFGGAVGTSTVHVPFSYIYTSPEAQTLELAVRLEMAGVRVDFAGNCLLLIEHRGREVRGLQFIWAREEDGVAGPFPWHLTLSLDGPGRGEERRVAQVDRSHNGMGEQEPIGESSEPATDLLTWATHPLILLGFRA